ncbi:MAG TPA: hypothetical protein VMU16_06950 [Candidatus Binataceae bacterium]|nr:hypothetical protein [Candidatus Binataceae bacterium]
MARFLKRSKPVFFSLIIAIAALALLFPAIVPGPRDAVVSICSRAGTNVSRLPFLARLIGIAAAQTGPATDTCASGTLTPGDPNNIPATPPDLEITKGCKVVGGPGGKNNTKHYFYSNVNIYNGGTLTFEDSQIDFWAKSIIVENKGTLNVGTASAPIGTKGRGPVGASGTARSIVTINLWGAEQTPDNGAGVECKSTPIKPPNDQPNWQASPCGIPVAIWNATDKAPVKLDNGVTDFFYKYDTMFADGADPNAYFGYKVIGLSYGGEIRMLGVKGSTKDTKPVPDFPLMTGVSWVRLDQGDKKVLKKGDPTLSVEGDVTRGGDASKGGWEAGDEIVVTSTDYLPGHSEQLKIGSLSYDKASNRTTITLDTVNGNSVQWTHNGNKYDLTSVKIPSGGTVNVKDKLKLNIDSEDTRAAVGLLSRSIVIQSAGTSINIAAQDGSGVNQPFPAASTHYFFGGHTVFRQGFQTAKFQGVEFHQMGQGGKQGHYPLHFHMARKVPEEQTFIKDCSINESMTRWIVLHATQGATLARNVGYKSIGHGYYLEDATETNNNLFSNLGVFARAAVNNVQNPRQVPGILARPQFNNDNTADVFPFHSDWDHPAVFWITNAWNKFAGNMAVGAGTCGACYWFVPAGISGGSLMMKWKGYAGIQAAPGGFGDIGRADIAPLKEFYGNTCSSAEVAIMTVGATSSCLGVGDPNQSDNLQPVANSLAPPFTQPTPTAQYKMYYPNVAPGASRAPTRCSDDNGDCSTVGKCADGVNEKNCTVDVIDHFTTAFNWAQKNFSAVWLRQMWFLFINSAMSDVQFGGLTFVSGGDYTKSSAPTGYWALAKKSVFIGDTQTGNPYASNLGPFVPGGTVCDTPVTQINRCVSQDEGIAFPLDNYGVFQRFANIYDGPSYQESNAYLDITKGTLANCLSGPDQTCLENYPYARVLGLLKDSTQASGSQCYLPNAAIAWKQPNGFYYPPAFHSSKLFFNNVDIRHFVIEPDLLTGTFYTDSTAQAAKYCKIDTGAFTGFSDIDRQTELNDDDGSLTGMIGTISVNEDPFFNAPLETDECASNVGIGAQSVPTATPTPAPPGATAKTSPYDYVTTVVFPDCATKGNCGNDPIFTHRGGDWSRDCGSNFCYGVPLYRQYLTGTDQNGATQFIRMMAQDTWQRSNLTVNHSNYYIDTTKNNWQQYLENFTPEQTARSVNIFRSNNTYYVFFVFAKGSTEQTYQLYVGPGFSATPTNDQVFFSRVNVSDAPVNPSKGTADDWTNSGWMKSYDSGTGILTVHIDMTKFAKKLNPLLKSTGLCKPDSFCGWKGTEGKETCGCTATNADYPVLSTDTTLKDECDAVCSTWAVKDLDCPDDGCYGFGVTLPDGFDTAIGNHPTPTVSPTPIPVTPTPPATPTPIMATPTPTLGITPSPKETPTPACFPTSTAWTSPGFVIAPTPVAGAQCFYSGTPPNKFCK